MPKLKNPQRSKTFSPTQHRANLPNVNRLDHQIHLQNGTTSVTELSQQRLQQAKHTPPTSLFAKVEELTKELGRLRQEIHFYRQCFEILQRLRETTYDVYQQFFLAHYLGTDSDRMNEIITQLHHGLEDSMRREIEAEKVWMEFWGVKSHKLAGEWI